MVESCCPPHLGLRVGAIVSHYYCWGVYKASAVPGAGPWGRDFSPEGLDVGSGNDGADQASADTLLAWNFKDVDPLLSIDSHPHWSEGGAGVKASTESALGARGG